MMSGDAFTAEELEYLRQIHTQLNLAEACLLPALNGGRDSHHDPLPGLRERVISQLDRLGTLAQGWAQARPATLQKSACVV